MGVLTLLAGLAWAGRSPLLRGLVDLWTVDDRIEKADAVVLLGGGIETRTFAAARLQMDGTAGSIVIFNTRPSPSEKAGYSRSNADSLREILIKQGVSDTAIQVIGTDVRNTRDEAFAVRDWLKATGPKKIIIPTEFPHTRRTRWVFRKALAGTGGQVLMHAIDPWDYTRDDWWRHEQGVVAVQNEVMKFLYYCLKY